MRYIPLFGKAALRRLSILAIVSTVAVSLMQPATCSASDEACHDWPVQTDATVQEQIKPETKKSPRGIVRLRRLGGPSVFLGVFPQTLSEERAAELGVKEKQGVYVLKVVPGSPAETGGLKKGDVIIEFNGQPVVNNEQFRDYLRKCEPGKPVTLGVARNSQSQRVTVVPEKSEGAKVFEVDPQSGSFEFNFENGTPNSFPDIRAMAPGLIAPDGKLKEFTTTLFERGRLGIRTQNLSEQLAGYFGVNGGVLVTEVIGDSAAGKAGLKAGDCITKVGDTSIDSVSELIQTLQKIESGPVALTIVREKRTLVFSVNLEKRAEAPAFAPFLMPSPEIPGENFVPVQPFRLSSPQVRTLIPLFEWNEFSIVL